VPARLVALDAWSDAAFERALVVLEPVRRAGGVLLRRNR
jgi:hypothetical protein